MTSIPTGGRLMVRCPFCGEEKDSGILADEKLTKAFGHALCHNGHNWEWSLGETYREMAEDKAMIDETEPEPESSLDKAGNLLKNLLVVPKDEASEAPADDTPGAPGVGH